MQRRRTLRIFDRIASGQSVFHGPRSASNQSAIDAMHRKFVNTSTRVIADESSFYVEDRGWSHKDINDFGVLLPPFDSMWIEWRTREGDHIAMSVVRKVQDKDDHAIVAMLFSYSPSLRVVARLPASMQAMTMRDSRGSWVTAYGGAVQWQDDNRFNHHFAPGWLAIAWMNCNNLSLERTSLGSRLIKKRRKRGQPTGLDYCRIVIGDKYKRQWEKSSGVSATRFHAVRGHLATYTPDKPMFGKYVGTFWKPSHVRGDKDLGRINHEYHVQPRGSR